MGRGVTREEGPETLSWSADIPILTNRYLLRDMLLVFLASIAALYVLVFLGGLVWEREVIILPLAVFAIVFGVLTALFVLTGLVLGNRIGTRFTVDSRGVTSEAERRERAINRLLVVLGLLSGSPGAAGAGMLAAGRERESVPWARVEEVVVRPRARVIELRGRTRTLQRLHCPPELFGEVEEAVRSHAGPSVRFRG